MEKRKISLNEISKIINVGFTKKSRIINAFHYADYQSSYNSVLTYCLNEIYIKKALKNKSIKAIITSKDIFNNLKFLIRSKFDNIWQNKGNFVKLGKFWQNLAIFIKIRSKLVKLRQKLAKFDKIWQNLVKIRGKLSNLTKFGLN